MDYSRAHDFVEGSLEAWNAHDVDAVLAHFADDATFTSPVAARILEGSDGIVHTIVINYRNQAGGLVSEVLTFDGPLVVEGHGTYLGHDA